MNMKKLALAGVIALVVLGCVLAAGCTSTTTTQTASDDLKQVTGEWYAKYTYDGTTYDIIQTIKSDATGYWIMINDSRVYEVYSSTYSNFDGKGNFDKTSSNGTTYKMNYSNGVLKETGGDTSEDITYTRMDPIAGFWFDKGTDTVTKKVAKFTHVFEPNETGYDLISNDDGTATVSAFTWKKNSDGTYTLTFANGLSNTWKLDQDKGTVTEGNYTFTVEKKFSNADHRVMILGPWYDEENKCLAFFNADGTYTIYQGKEKIGEGTWTAKDFGTYVLKGTGTTPSGEDVSGREATWTYDIENNTFTTHDGTVFIRPSEAVENLTLEVFSIDDLFTGLWTFTNDDGVHVVSISPDGNGFITTIAKENGTRIVKHSALSEQMNEDGTITGKLAKEDVIYTKTYDPETDTIESSLGHSITRLDPVTGIWFDQDTDGITGIWYDHDTDGITGKNAKFSDIFKPDGSGVVAIENDDGTTKVVESAWKKNADGSYTVTYADGFEETFTYDADTETITTTTGTTWSPEKKFDDSYYYLSILGPWYDKENKYLAFFNADGTYSVYQDKTKTGEGTWYVKEYGKFALNGTGKTPAGKDVSGQERIWTYDREKDTFTTYDGTVFVRPSGDLTNLSYVKFN